MSVRYINKGIYWFYEDKITSNSTQREKWSELKQNGKPRSVNKMNEINIGKNVPERKFKASPVTATVWVNEGRNSKDEPSTYRTISLERSYKDKEDNWKKTNSLRVNDLPKAILVLNKAYEYVAVTEEGETIDEEVTR